MDFDENIGGAALTLSAADITEIETLLAKMPVIGHRYLAQMQATINR
ncbi:hypothetical protein [Pantoea sp. JK]|nr:hypothetical protein [Pantoea sp. JK]MCW6030095.1 hypothetical protein [Pantoea sp. JK]